MFAFSYLNGEEYEWTPSRKVLIDEQIQLKNVPLFGYIKSVATPSTKLHTHKNTIEFTYIVKGQQTFCTESAEYHVFGGECFIMPANIVHGTGIAPVEKQEMFWFQINFNDVIDFLGLDEKYGSILVEQLMKIPICKIKPEGDMRFLCSETLENLHQKDPLKHWKAVTNIHQMLYMIITGKPGVTTLSQEIIQVIRYLDNHLCEDISLEKLSELSFLSLSRFKERFRMETGVSPREYVNFKKIELAKSIIQGTEKDLNITDLAMMLGFSSSAYFSVVFRKFTALSPSEYKLYCTSEKV